MKSEQLLLANSIRKLSCRFPSCRSPKVIHLSPPFPLSGIWLPNGSALILTLASDLDAISLSPLREDFLSFRNISCGNLLRKPTVSFSFQISINERKSQRADRPEKSADSYFARDPLPQILMGNVRTPSVFLCVFHVLLKRECTYIVHYGRIYKISLRTMPMASVT